MSFKNCLNSVVVGEALRDTPKDGCEGDYVGCHRLSKDTKCKQRFPYHQALKPGFHIIAPVATIAAVVEKRVSATVAIYGNILFSDSSDKYDSSDERR